MEVVLITEKQINIDIVKSTIRSPIKFIDDNKGIYYSGGQGTYIAVYESPENRAYYENSELQDYENAIGPLNFFVVIFNDFDLFKQFLTCLPIEMKVFIDNDFGKILQKKDLLRFNSYGDFTSS